MRFASGNNDPEKRVRLLEDTVERLKAKCKIQRGAFELYKVDVRRLINELKDQEIAALKQRVSVLEERWNWKHGVNYLIPGPEIWEKSTTETDPLLSLTATPAVEHVNLTKDPIVRQLDFQTVQTVAVRSDTEAKTRQSATDQQPTSSEQTHPIVERMDSGTVQTVAITEQNKGVTDTKAKTRQSATRQQPTPSKERHPIVERMDSATVETETVAMTDVKKARQSATVDHQPSPSKDRHPTVRQTDTGSLTVQIVTTTDTNKKKRQSGANQKATQMNNNLNIDHKAKLKAKRAKVQLPTATTRTRKNSKTTTVRRNSVCDKAEVDGSESDDTDEIGHYSLQKKKVVRQTDKGTEQMAVTDTEAKKKRQSAAVQKASQMNDNDEIDPKTKLVAKKGKAISPTTTTGNTATVRNSVRGKAEADGDGSESDDTETDEIGHYSTQKKKVVRQTDKGTEQEMAVTDTEAKKKRQSAADQKATQINDNDEIDHKAKKAKGAKAMSPTKTTGKTATVRNSVRDKAEADDSESDDTDDSPPQNKKAVRQTDTGTRNRTVTEQDVDVAADTEAKTRQSSIDDEQPTPSKERHPIVEDSETVQTVAMTQVRKKRQNSTDKHPTDSDSKHNHPTVRQTDTGSLTVQIVVNTDTEANKKRQSAVDQKATQINDNDEIDHKAKVKAKGAKAMSPTKTTGKASKTVTVRNSLSEKAEANDSESDDTDDSDQYSLQKKKAVRRTDTGSRTVTEQDVDTDMTRQSAADQKATQMNENDDIDHKTKVKAKGAKAKAMSPTKTIGKTSKTVTVQNGRDKAETDDSESDDSDAGDSDHKKVVTPKQGVTLIRKPRWMEEDRLDLGKATNGWRSKSVPRATTPSTSSKRPAKASSPVFAKKSKPGF